MIRRMMMMAGIILFAFSCDPGRGVPVFLWHSVGEGGTGDKYDVSPEEFDRELSAIESFGAVTITLDQLFNARYGKGVLPERAVILTFDDGRASQYNAAMPILLKHGMVAETFIVAGKIGDDNEHRHIEQDEDGNHPYLIWPELAEMVRSGAFRVQSHSMTHPRYSVQIREKIPYEVAESRRLISEKLGMPVNFYAYPFGKFDGWYKDEVENAGYRGGMSVQSGMGTRYAMLRVSMYPYAEQVLVDTLKQNFSPRK